MFIIPSKYRNYKCIRVDFGEVKILSRVLRKTTLFLIVKTFLKNILFSPLKKWGGSAANELRNWKSELLWELVLFMHLISDLN